MALTHNIKPIITDGLVMCLDAANKRSYPGSGGTWYNAAQPKLTPSAANPGHAYIRGTPTYVSSNGGAIYTPPSQTSTYVELPETILQSLPNGLTWTMEIVITVLDGSNQFTSARYGPHMSVSGGNDFIWYWYSTGSGVGASSLYGATAIVGTDATWAVGTPFILTLTRNGTAWRAYKNGVYCAEYTLDTTNTTLIQAWILDQEADGVKGGFDPNQNLSAWWHRVSFYNRVLFDSEIVQNFDALRGRFGI